MVCRLCLLFLILLKPIFVSADEGMWMLPFLKDLNEFKMKQAGMKLSAEDIYNPIAPSLKDAVVLFDNKCSAEMISSQGLLLTNHHCGYDAIQHLSTSTNDLLKKGFWAHSRAEELCDTTVRVAFMLRFEEVTERVLSAIPAESSWISREYIVDSISNIISVEASDSGKYESSVESFFDANRFFLVVYEVFRDVRLVGAPPESIGSYGGDTDNWMWPRHTGDFSMFRIYGDSLGCPASYSKNNIPIKPKKFFPISIKGIQEGDFSMVMGFPGSTDRYMTSWEVNQEMTVINPNRIKTREIKQKIWTDSMHSDAAINLKYSARYKHSSNYWKYSIGQNLALKKLNVQSRKEEQEKAFNTWSNSDSLLMKNYGGALNKIKNGVNNKAEFLHAGQLLSECFYNSVDLFRIGREIFITAAENYDKTSQQITNIYPFFVFELNEYFKNYDIHVEKKTAVAMMNYYIQNVDAQYIPYIYATIQKKYKGNLNKFLAAMYDKSILADSAKLVAFLKAPNREVLLSDIGFKAVYSIIEKSNFTLEQRNSCCRNEFLEGRNEYMRGLLTMHADSVFYPDANFTMRTSYGKIKGYNPTDAVHYNYYTTLDGVISKMNPENKEFIVPEKLMDLYQQKDFGEYGLNGKVPVAFISTNDITGGNSGSPVINAKGELIGTAFDGNWESMSGDIQYEPQLQRCISVDVRYVLFIVEKLGGCKYLIDEMELVR